MFIHFGLSTFAEKELSWGTAKARFPDSNGTPPYTFEEWTSWAQRLRLEKFSKEELARILKASGMRYLVLTVKHHEGFHLWDTAYSTFKVTRTPYGKDFMREVIEACRLAGVKVGLYYSQRDWYHPDYCPIDPETADPSGRPPHWQAKPGKTPRPGIRHKNYLDYQSKVVEELCTKYGKIDLFWWDAVWYGESIYGTRGGPFLPGAWGGATFRGNHVWLHVVRVPKEGKLTLPRLPGITFVKQEMLSGEGAIFRETPEGYVLDLSGLKRSDQPIIFKLTANRELTLKDVQGVRQEAPARVAIATGTVGQTLSWEGLRTVTAVRVRSKASATFTVETSADGETWHAQAPMKVSAQTAVEIPVTVFQAGAFIEGVKANRLRVSATPAVSAEMEVLAVAE